MKVHFKVKGPLIWLDENGDAVDFFDVHRVHRHLQGALREGRPRRRLHRHAVALSRARAAAAGRPTAAATPPTGPTSPMRLTPVSRAAGMRLARDLPVHRPRAASRCSPTAPC